MRSLANATPEPVTAADIPWCAFAPPAPRPVQIPGNPDAPADAAVLAHVLVEVLRHLRTHKDLLSVAMDTIAEQHRELAAARRRNAQLVEDVRAARKVAA